MKKHEFPVYHSESEALLAVAGVSNLVAEKIDKPYHHKERVKVYSQVGIVKKYRGISPRSINKTYNEAKAHIDLTKIGVNVPRLFGVLHSDKECSLFMEYVESKPLTSFLVSSKGSLFNRLISTGEEFGKMFEHWFLHGDLTSYHVFINDSVHIFDLEATRKYGEENFYVKLIDEWKGFIDSTTGRRWKIPFTKEQEEAVFEGVCRTLENKKTKKIIEKIVLNF